MTLNIALGILACLSVALSIWQWLAAQRFPPRQRVNDPAFAPAVTRLKSPKDCDPETANCLRSWFAQDYTGVTQVLFGVTSPDDPVCAGVKKLISELPAREARWVVCGPLLGANAKVAKIARLEKFAKHDLLVISDADMRVPTDFPAKVVAPPREAKVGLVNCFYRLANRQPSRCAGKPSPSTPISGARFCNRKL